MPEVLVVDDSKVIREMVVACLRGLDGLAFTHAASGLEAIERLSLKPFSLLILDLNMPDIGGQEVIEFVRGQDRLRALPILVVTTRGDDQSRTQALAAGASRFMTKPFTPDAIQAEVRGLLGPTGWRPMTDRLDVQEFLGGYFAEMDEHIAAASRHLLAIDEDLERGDTNPRAVREPSGRCTPSRASRRWSGSSPSWTSLT